MPFARSLPRFVATRRRLGAAALAVSLTSTALPAAAAASTLQPEETTLRAQQLYREGQNFYETANYTGAIQKWTQAYGLMEWGPDTAEAKTSMLYNLAAAHEKQYGISKNVQNLRTAKVLLQSFAERIPTIYGETPEAKAELDRVEHRIAEIDAQIDEASGTGVAVPDVPDDPDEPGEPDETESSTPEAPSSSDEQPVEQDDPDADASARAPKNVGRPLFYGGAAAIGLGVAAGGGAIAFTILSDQQNNFDDVDPFNYKKRNEQIDKGLLYNELAVGLGVTAGVLVVSGMVLALVGKRRMAKEESRTVYVDGVGPVLGRERSGVALTGRF